MAETNTQRLERVLIKIVESEFATSPQRLDAAANDSGFGDVAFAGMSNFAHSPGDDRSTIPRGSSASFRVDGAITNAPKPKRG